MSAPLPQQSDYKYGLPSPGVDYLRSHLNKFIEHLPNPDAGDWTANQAGLAPSTCIRLKELGLIIQTGTTPSGCRNGHTAYQYATLPKTKATIDAMRESRDYEWPCGHAGIQNPRNQDGFQCGYDHCDELFDEDTAEEVLN